MKINQKEPMPEILDDEKIWDHRGSFEFYRDFHNMEQAEEFAKLLKENGIAYSLEKNQTLLDAAIVGHGLVPPALVKIRTADFPKVNSILEKQALENPHFLESHYLRQLDDRELIDMIRNPDQWNVEDVAVARRILSERGISIPKEHVEEFAKKKNEALHAGKRAEPKWMFVSLLCVLAGGAFVSPLFLIGGVGMGWYFWRDKTVDNQGVKFYTFDKTTRLYGKLIFYFGWLSLFIGGALIFWLGNGKGLSENKNGARVPGSVLSSMSLQSNVNCPGSVQVFLPFHSGFLWQKKANE